MIDMTLANVKVSSIERAEEWYSRVFGCPPDSRPMDGLIEWRFGLAHGVQVFRDPSDAGRSAAVVGTTDLGAMIVRLDTEGIEHGGIQPGGGGRLVEVSDPDGNQVVILDDAAAHGCPTDDVAHGAFRFRRTLEAPVERAWSAYVDVEQRSVWAVPEGEEVVYDAADFAVGGRDSYRCGTPGDLAIHVTTSYVRIDTPRSFVAVNEVHRDDTAVAVDITHWLLEADGATTRLTVEVQVTSLAGVGVLDGYRIGHERTFDHLEQFLA